MAEGKLKRLTVRTLSGSVYASLMVVSTLYPVVMIPLMCFLTIIGLAEYYKMTDPQAEDTLSRNVLMALTFLIYLMLLLTRISPMLPIGSYQLFHFLLVTFLLLAMLALVRHKSAAAQSVGLSLFAMLWIIMPLCLMTNSCLHEGMGDVVLLIFVLIWINDTFAYLGGSLYGRHKMTERISPNKTWEGTVTGFVFTMSASMLAGWLWADQIIPGGTFHWYGWMLFGFFTSLLATMGDLLESLLKRQAGVKDSGNLIPGHGGVLDRMDSILLTVYPLISFLLVLLML